MYVYICIDEWWLLMMRLSDRWWCLESHHTPSWYLLVIDYYHIWSTAHSAININHQCGTAGTRCHSSVSNPDVERCIELVMTYIDGHFRYYFYQILLLLLLVSSSSPSSISSWHFFKLCYVTCLVGVGYAEWFPWQWGAAAVTTTLVGFGYKYSREALTWQEE